MTFNLDDVQEVVSIVDSISENGREKSFILSGETIN
jgi:hypothetical protein